MPTASVSGSEKAPIERCLDRWHDFLRSGDPDRLDDLLHDDCVFTSPIVFTPQKGKELTKLYLTAAGSSLGGKSADTTAGSPAPGRSPGPDKESDWDGRFRYVRTVSDGYDAVLEFETTLDGKYVNGVDMITCDADGLIVDFKVMVRPLQAVNAVHEQVRAALEQLQG